jgi:lipopolysaccharide export LptBFGC system permease protein LptF
VQWPGRIDVELLPLIFAESRDLTVQQMHRLIRNQGYGQRPTYLFRTWMQQRLSLMVTPFLMICLVASLAQRFSRTGGFARLFLLGGAIGFGFSIFDGTALAMGEAGLVTPWLAAWLPKLALACAIGAFTLRFEF